MHTVLERAPKAKIVANFFSNERAFLERYVRIRAELVAQTTALEPEPSFD